VLYPEDSEIDGGRLRIGGCDAAELAAEFGTPLYVVAEDDLRSRARAFTGAMGDGEVVFASKAFPCTAVLKVFHEEGLSVDVASGGELALAQKAGYTGERIVFHGNAKSAAELKAAAEAGARIVVDNFDELDKLEALQAPVEVMIRVTPGVVADTHAAILTGHAGSKFGFSLPQAPEAIERLTHAPWADLKGLHMHIGSQLFDLEPWRLAVEAIATLGDFGAYDLGGGLAVAYTTERTPPTVQQYVDTMRATADELLGPGKALSIEPGRALVASAGVTLYTVESVKDVDLPDGRVRFVAVDGGMSDNLRPMLYGARYEAEIADRFGGESLCMVAGMHCESSDILVRDVMLDDPKPGDVLVIPATGAYGHAMANNYNSLRRPPVIFCKDGDARVVVRRETFDDLTARDVF